MPDTALYQTERYTNSENLVYEIPLTKGQEDGHYVLVLKFSEVYFGSAGQKVFDVALGSSTILSDVDIYSKVGKFAPYDEFIEFDVKNKVLLYHGEKVESAISSRGALVLKFLRGKADNPKVNAIVLVKGTLDDTDYKEYQEIYSQKDRLQKMKDERESKKRRKDIEGMLEADDDLDLSTLGQKEVGKSEHVKDKDPIRMGINELLDISYGLESACLAFVVLFFFLFSFVSLQRSNKIFRF